MRGIFCSDLDNTLIYSSQHLPDNTVEKQCVEKLDGRELSYMTKQSLVRLKRLQERMLFVPITTRSIEQYKRIHLPITPPPYAIVCNGGVLLKNGEMDQEWYRQSLECIEESREELDKGQKILEIDEDRNFEVRLIEGLFLFTKSKAPERTVQRLKAALNQGKAEIFSNGSKIYVVPKELNKGKAVERIREKIKADCVFAAGDSAFDLPMLRAADWSAAPAQLKELYEKKRKRKGKGREGEAVFLNGEIFSDVMLEYFFHKMEQLICFQKDYIPGMDKNAEWRLGEQ